MLWYMQDLFAYFHDPDELFHTEKGDDATEHSKPNRHIMRVMSPIPTMAAISVNIKSTALKAPLTL